MVGEGIGRWKGVGISFVGLSGLKVQYDTVEGGGDV